MIHLTLDYSLNWECQCRKGTSPFLVKLSYTEILIIIKRSNNKQLKTSVREFKSMSKCAEKEDYVFMSNGHVNNNNINSKYNKNQIYYKL